MATLAETRVDVLDKLNNGGGFWTPTQIDRWINEAQRDIARRAETIQDISTSIPIFPGIPKYQLPADVIRVHRVEFIPVQNGSPSGYQIYPVQLTTYDEMDQRWGVIQNQQMSYPAFACMWGAPPTLQMQFFPVPSQPGNINIFYYRVPKTLTDDNDVLEVPTGWEDLVALYAEYVARRKDRDPTWQDAKTLYEERLIEFGNVTRQWHDQAQQISIGTSAVPQWLYDFGYDG